MAVHTAVSLSTVALLVENESNDRVDCVITPAAKIYVGGAGVTTVLGTPVLTNVPFHWTLAPKESLYGIADTGTVDVRVLVAAGADLTGV